ncbi:hypothetical protein [Lentzea sp. NPDC059081]|uniref:AMIN-like domain-containing (lipo)protein n=1 Tax=Lentzea sp. NPDC059081 TaxID=3346719 RepID=UPI0036C6FA03
MKRIAAVLVAAAMAMSFAPSAFAAEGTALTEIRTGVHAGFDRVEFEFTGARPGVAEYRTTELERCGSGKPMWAPGDEFLVVTMQPANAHDHTGPREFETPGLSQVRGVANTCDFEAHLEFAIGYAGTGRAYTVSVQDNPTRVVVDIHNS